MNCSEFDEQVTELLDGVASVPIERALRNHILLCQSCTGQWEEMKIVQTLLQKSAIPSPSDGLDARVMSGFQNRTVSRKSITPLPGWRQFLHLPAPTLAASIGAIVMALLFGFGIGRISVMQPLEAIDAGLPSSTPIVSPKPRDPETGRQALSAHTPKSETQIHKRVSPKLGGTVFRKTPALESLTVVSSGGANYATRAILDGFEPISGTRLRVIKTGEEK